MDERKPGYYAIIPADVRYDDRIPANAKLLYGEISALIGAEGYCFASNQYFSEVYGCTPVTVARLISKLEEAGYIKRELVRDNSGQIIQRKLFLSVSMPDIQPLNNFDNTPQQNCGEGLNKNVKDTDLSNTDVKESKKRKVSRPEPLTDEELRTVVIDKIVEIAQPSWPKETKNDLFKWAMALYDPNRTVKKAHPVRSKLSVDGTFRKLKQYGGDNPNTMIWMLCSAVEAGWQGVQPPSGNQPPAQNQESGAGREEEWL